MHRGAVIRSSILLLSLLAQQSSASEAPISIQIAALSDHIRSAAGLALIVTTTNTSDHEITFEETSRICDYELDVRDEKGARAQDTFFRQQIKCSSEGPQITGMDIIYVLKPGESHEVRISVTEASDISKPGVYAIQISRRVPGDTKGAVVKSNIIKVTVTP
jgi:hypothetical protein